MVHQIIYTSAGKPELTPRDFRNIAIRASQQNNALNITGILLFFDGGILQVLEGDKDIIQALYQKIAGDDRHTNLTKLIDRTADKREFPAWSMGFRMVEDSEQLDFAFDLTRQNFEKNMPEGVSAEVSILTNTYARIQRI
ncbi:BLUF domain-containing protein [Fretibacter rubidus]|uniref:BLUF domain-containing protein n=1 Tax=Fretibacter rubidus TaxID=570162 RepID=UPI00352A181D